MMACSTAARILTPCSATASSRICITSTDKRVPRGTVISRRPAGRPIFLILGAITSAVGCGICGRAAGVTSTGSTFSSGAGRGPLRTRAAGRSFISSVIGGSFQLVLCRRPQQVHPYGRCRTTPESGAFPGRWCDEEQVASVAGLFRAADQCWPLRFGS